MIWSIKPSENELGEYLPDADAYPYQQSETVVAPNDNLAKIKCNEIAAEYGGVNPQVEEIQPNLYDCNFTLWS